MYAELSVLCRWHKPMSREYLCWSTEKTHHCLENMYISIEDT